MKVLIIGLGKMGGLHASKINAVAPDAEIFVLDHHQSEDTISPYRLVTVDTLPLVDVVVIASPTALHCEHIKLVIERLGSNLRLLLVEKPFGIDSTERLTILEQLATLGIPVAVNSIEVLNPDVRALKNTLRDAQIFPHCIRCIRESKSLYDVDPLLDLGWHDLSVVFELFSNISTLQLTDRCTRGTDRSTTSTTSHCNFQVVINSEQPVDIEIINRVHRMEAEVSALQRAIEIDFVDWSLKLDFINGDIVFKGSVPAEITTLGEADRQQAPDKLETLWKGLLKGVDSGRFDPSIEGFFRIKPIAEVYKAATHMNLVE